MLKSVTLSDGTKVEETAMANVTVQTDGTVIEQFKPEGIVDGCLKRCIFIDDVCSPPLPLPLLRSPQSQPPPRSFTTVALLPSHWQLAVAGV